MGDPVSAGSTVISFLSGGIGGAAALLAKEFLAPIFLERRTLKRKQTEVYRAYLAPLYASCESLLWRMDEILVRNRPEFLMTKTMPLGYNRYKRISTLYRIASVIGWLRAMEIELNSLPQGASLSDVPLSEPIGDWKRALADGQHVEEHRLEQVCGIWKIQIESIGKDEKEKLAASFEVKLYELAGERFKVDSEYIENISDEDSFKLCHSLCSFLCQKLSRSCVSDKVILETLNQALSCLSYREALIYREWQGAIGDMLLVPDLDSPRRYKLIGFGEFEVILLKDIEWIATLRGAIDDINLTDRNPNDFRVFQLQNMAAAIGKIILGISASKNSDLVTPPAFAAARKLVCADKLAHQRA